MGRKPSSPAALIEGRGTNAVPIESLSPTRSLSGGGGRGHRKSVEVTKGHQRSIEVNRGQWRTVWRTVKGSGVHERSLEVSRGQLR